MALRYNKKYKNNFGRYFDEVLVYVSLGRMGL